jgi:hypothetical protein
MVTPTFADYVELLFTLFERFWQQYLMSQGSPPRMKIARLFSGEYPAVCLPA